MASRISSAEVRGEALEADVTRVTVHHVGSRDRVERNLVPADREVEQVLITRTLHLDVDERALAPLQIPLHQLGVEPDGRRIADLNDPVACLQTSFGTRSAGDGH